ncbi:MAG: sulfurtransferase, partial [Candidatus Hydrothermarchaeaceae archaeon]
DVVIHDNRARGEYTGEKILEGNERGGHIRGAVFLEWEKALNPDGTFKSKEELKEIYEAVGITPDKEIIIYCQGGVRVSHTLLALKYILGYPNVRNYDGSWDEWSNIKNPDGTYKYPVET